MITKQGKYKPEYCEEIIAFMGQGYSKEAFAGEIGVSKQAVYRWIKKHKEFRNAVKRAEEKCRLFWEGLGIEMVLQGQGNATTWIFNMKNRFRREWNDKIQTDITTNGKELPTPILNAIYRNDSNKETVETSKED